jgi:hypothetical protein
MNALQNHTSITASLLTAHTTIQILTTELRAADAIIHTLHRFMPHHQLLHAKLDLQRVGEANTNALRTRERGAVIKMADGFPSPSPSLLTSQDLIRRLRTLAGQTRIKPPALDLEAADHIETLEAWIALHVHPAAYAKAELNTGAN